MDGKVVEQICELFEDTSIRDKDGNVPLHMFARYAKNPDITITEIGETLVRYSKTLFKYSSKTVSEGINTRNDNGETALHFAVCNPNLRLPMVPSPHNTFYNCFF
jgi:ankyrin repeat protein